jgi:ABC-2 type transport system permease protein
MLEQELRQKMKTLKKYLSLYVSFFKASFIADLEFRANFILRVVTDVFWYLAQIITFESLYRFTKLIGSWNLEQTRVFLGIVFIVDGIYMILFHDNLDKISDRVRKGEMDLLLAKPVNSQFMISLGRASTVLIGNLMVGISYFIWALSGYSNFSPWSLLWLLILIPCGLICFYSIRFFIASTSVIFTRSENLQYLWYQIYRLGLRPDSIYAPWLKFILLTFLPVGVIASVPARALLDPPNLWLFAWVVFLAASLLYISHRFWNFCMRHYTSASS